MGRLVRAFAFQGMGIEHVAEREIYSRGNAASSLGDAVAPFVLHPSMHQKQ